MEFLLSTSIQPIIQKESSFEYTAVVSMHESTSESGNLQYQYCEKKVCERCEMFSMFLLLSLQLKIWGKNLSMIQMSLLALVYELQNIYKY